MNDERSRCALRMNEERRPAAAAARRSRAFIVHAHARSAAQRSSFIIGAQLMQHNWLPKLVLAPSFVLSFLFIYGFMAWNGYLSLSASRLLPNYGFVGIDQYVTLFESDRFRVALTNMGIFGGLFIGGAMALGIVLAILLDQKIRGEGFLRTVYMYPMAISFIVTGTAWKWMLNPGLGLQHLMRQWGFESFTFEWLVESDMAIYCIVIAGVWQSAGFVMALFLAGLRGIDDSIIKAAQVDGASLPRIYWRIIVPTLRPVFFSTLMVVSHLAIKSFDLVMALTAGGPGYATDLPATFMYAMSFSRGQIGLGAASATVMLATVAAIVVPYLYSELRGRK
jgi:glucose/mannose transport system permease protein